MEKFEFRIYPSLLKDTFYPGVDWSSTSNEKPTRAYTPPAKLNACQLRYTSYKSYPPRETKRSPCQTTGRRSMQIFCVTMGPKRHRKRRIVQSLISTDDETEASVSVAGPPEPDARYRSAGYPRDQNQHR